MESVWFGPELADEIMSSDEIFQETQSIITDIVSDRLTITRLVENMGGVLTNKDADNREKGMRFFTKLLKELPKDYLNEMQVKFISKFYVDRLKDNHRVIPDVLEGYLAIMSMSNYNIDNCGEFLAILFREVACQSQVRQDRYNIYLIIHKLMDKNLEYMKSLGPDFVYGFISSMDGERDPRNLVFLFALLPRFISNIPLGHLIDEMFEVISCYFPIDFHPSPDDPGAVSRQELANALAPCLCATPDFAEQCLILLVEKLDSSLRLAKLDSLQLLIESCKTFKPQSYIPFLKAIWSSIHREIMHKTDDEIKLLAHQALTALVNKLSTCANTDQTFENFVKGILIAMQTTVAESSTVAQFVQASQVLLTTANSCKEACVIITKSMIPAIIAYYEFKTSPKLQIASLDFVGDLYEMAAHWEVLDQIETQVNEIPRLCLTSASVLIKDYQIAGFRALIRVKNVLQQDLVVPFVEILVHNVQHSQEDDLLKISVEAVHAIARKYPELIMNLVVKGKCDLDHLTEDKIVLQKRLNLLSNLASIDDFTKIIIEEMLKLITTNDKEASKVIEALSESLSDSSLFTDQKVTQIESDHGLIESILTWLLKEIEADSKDSLSHSYTLIATTISSLPIQKQEKIINKHTSNILDLCEKNDTYFLVLESLYSSLSQNLYDSKFENIIRVSLKLSLNSENEVVRNNACALIAHFLNKAEYGQKFELLYESLREFLSNCDKTNEDNMCLRLIMLYGWITKALLMRGSDMFLFWLQKITNILKNPSFCVNATEAIQLIMNEDPDHLTAKQHCRTSLLYKQRMFVTFTKLTENFGEIAPEIKESYLLSWAYVLGKVPKSVLLNEANKISPIVIDSLEYDNKDLLLVMVDVLCHLVQAKLDSIGLSLQTILPRVVELTKYVKSMDVRIKSLQCLFDIANSYRTSLLLPYKQDILIDLAPSLDDKKRLVRNTAVRARTRWFLIGAPGEAKDN